VASFSRSEDAVSVTLENGDLEGQLLVAADGSRSALGTQCGVEWRSSLMAGGGHCERLYRASTTAGV
jgi:2-polyprenyl-6-methoxyphenol hydroxylase-like FAD-dependent oxidoreductase